MKNLKPGASSNNRLQLPSPSVEIDQLAGTDSDAIPVGELPGFVPDNKPETEIVGAKRAGDNRIGRPPQPAPKRARPKPVMATVETVVQPAVETPATPVRVGRLWQLVASVFQLSFWLPPTWAGLQRSAWTAVPVVLWAVLIKSGLGEVGFQATVAAILALAGIGGAARQLSELPRWQGFAAAIKPLVGFGLLAVLAGMCGPLAVLIAFCLSVVHIFTAVTD